MKTIWKFVLDATERQTVTLPAGARVLTVQAQGDTTCLWAEVNREKITEGRSVLVVGTGHGLPSDIAHFDYVGTAQIHGGSLVFHCGVRRAVLPACTRRRGAVAGAGAGYVAAHCRRARHRDRCASRVVH
jgi:hypothetical protein